MREPTGQFEVVASCGNDLLHGARGRVTGGVGCVSGEFSPPAHRPHAASAPSGSGEPPAVGRITQLESSDASHLAAEPMCFRETKELQSELLAMLDEPDDAIRFEKPYLPEKDFPIWEFVRKFNRIPKEIREDGESNKEENKLAQYIRKHKGKLHKETLALLNNLPGEDTYSWCKDLRSAKQRLEESKQKQLHIESEDEHCYRELCRRINVMLSDPSRAMLLEERYEKAFPNAKKKPKEAVLPKKRLSDSWMNAGLILKPKIPASCTAAEDKKQKRGKVSLDLIHYLM